MGVVWEDRAYVTEDDEHSKRSSRGFSMDALPFLWLRVHPVHDNVMDIDRPREVWQASKTMETKTLKSQGIDLLGQLRFERDKEEAAEAAHFAGVGGEVDADAVVKLLLHYWQIRPPSVLLSVTGSAQDMALDSRLELMIGEGVRKASTSSRAWVVTGGTDVGVMRLVGDALRARTTLDVNAEWRTPLIGIAPLSKVTNEHKLRMRPCGLSHFAHHGGHHGVAPSARDSGSSRPVDYIKSVQNSHLSAALDPNHSHFILVDDPLHPGWGGEIEMRGSVESRLAEMFSLPYVLLLVQGGFNSFKNVLNSLRTSSPVVIVRDSKGCARVLADFVGAAKSHRGRVVSTPAYWRHQLHMRLRQAKVHVPVTQDAEAAISEMVGLLLPQLGVRDREFTRAIDDLVIVCEQGQEDTLEVAILNAIVQSRKRRSRRRSQGLQMKKAVPFQQKAPIPHAKARDPLRYHAKFELHALHVPQHLVPWPVAWPEYAPQLFDAPVLLAEPRPVWSDPPPHLIDAAWRERIGTRPTEEKDAEGLRRVQFDPHTQLPRNPRGRTGLEGRGLLGKWGPNHAADPIVTRLQPSTNQLQMVAIRRKDTGDWAIPGGMVDAGETVTQTLRREFMEETGNIADPDQRANFESKMHALFDHGGKNIYSGYVDDPRTTDNAWIETTAVHFHCPPEIGDHLALGGGDDADKAIWLDVNPETEPRYANLYASHRLWVDRAAQTLLPHQHARSAHPKYPVRLRVEDGDVSWNVPNLCRQYEPPQFTAPAVLQNCTSRQGAGSWADPGDVGAIDGAVKAQRTTLEGPLEFRGGMPCNPRGRTGLAGRGLLGRWGPNASIVSIITRYHPQLSKPQVLVVKRRDTDMEALPGRLMRPNEKLSDALMKVFSQEKRSLSQPEVQKVHHQLGQLFTDVENHIVYQGYADDPRNTDHAWVEASTVHYHVTNEIDSVIQFENVRSEPARTVTGSQSGSSLNPMKAMYNRTSLKLRTVQKARQRSSQAIIDGDARLANACRSRTSVAERWQRVARASRHVQQHSAASTSISAVATTATTIAANATAVTPPTATATSVPLANPKWPLASMFLVRLRKRLERRKRPGDSRCSGGSNQALRTSDLAAIPEADDSPSSMDGGVRWVDIDEFLQLYASQHVWVHHATSDMQKKLPMVTCHTATGDHGLRLGEDVQLRIACYARATVRQLDSSGLSPDKPRFRQYGFRIDSEGRHVKTVWRESIDGLLDRLSSEIAKLGHVVSRERINEEVQKLRMQAASSAFMHATNPVVQNGSDALVALVSRWGQADVLSSVLSESDLHRKVEQVQEALEEVLPFVVNPSFDVNIVELLLQNGAKISEVKLATLFSAKGSTADPFDVFKWMEITANMNGASRTRWRPSSFTSMISESLVADRKTRVLPSLPSACKAQQLPPASPTGRRLSSASVDDTSSEAATQRRGVSHASDASAMVQGTGYRAQGASDTSAMRTSQSSSCLSDKDLNQQALRLPAQRWLRRTHQGSSKSLALRSLQWRSAHQATPWREEQVLVLDSFIPGFFQYAKNCTLVSDFDLMCWAICCGATECAKSMWRRTSSPLRAALLGRKMCRKILEARNDKARRVEDAELERLEQWLEAQTVLVLDQLTDKESARKLLLTHASEMASLGVAGKESNLMEVAVNDLMDNKAFIAHPMCQDICDEMWLGRSPAGGQIRLKTRKTQWILLLLQVLVPFARFVEFSHNDLYNWPVEIDAKGREQIHMRSSICIFMEIMHIPIFKRIVDFLSHLAFAVLFLSVSFHPVCASFTSVHSVLFVWVWAKGFQSALGTALQGRDYMSNVYKWVDLFTIITLLIFFAVALAMRDGQPSATLSPIAEASDLIAWWDLQNDGQVRARFVTPMTDAQGAHFLQSATDSCGWTRATEVLRTLLAVAAVLISLGLFEIMYVNKGIGTVLVCAIKMSFAIRDWMPVTMVMATGFGVALNLLIPYFQSEHSGGTLRPLEGSEFDLSAAGPFFATFWAAFGAFSPGEISGAPSGAFVAPVFIWFYCLVVLVLLVNLLIAMFNSRYAVVLKQAEVLMKLIKVQRLSILLHQYPVPPPFNLLLLPIDGLLILFQRCREKPLLPHHLKKVRFRGTSTVALQDDSVGTPRHRHSLRRDRSSERQSSFSVGGSFSVLPVLQTSRKLSILKGSVGAPPPSVQSAPAQLLERCTRRYILWRSLRGQGPFSHDDLTCQRPGALHDHPQASAVERTALRKVQDQRKRKEREQADLTSLRAEVSRRFDVLESRLEPSVLEGAVPHGGGPEPLTPGSTLGRATAETSFWQCRGSRTSGAARMSAPPLASSHDILPPGLHDDGAQLGGQPLSQPPLSQPPPSPLLTKLDAVLAEQVHQSQQLAHLTRACAAMSSWLATLETPGEERGPRGRLPTPASVDGGAALPGGPTSTGGGGQLSAAPTPTSLGDVQHIRLARASIASLGPLSPIEAGGPAPRHLTEGLPEPTALLAQLDDPDWSVRGAAVEALSKLPAAVLAPHEGALLAFEARETDVKVLLACTPALVALQPSSSERRWHALVGRLDDPDGGVRWAAAATLGRLASADLVQHAEALVAKLEDADSLVRMAAAETLGQLEAEDLAQHSAAIVARLNDQDEDVHHAAVATLQRFAKEAFGGGHATV